jgi:transforming growth factor-beta-induced protein
MIIDNHLIRILLAGSLATSLIACGDSDDEPINNSADAVSDTDGSGGDATVVPDTDMPDTDVVEVPDVTPDTDTTVEPDIAPDVAPDVEPGLGNIVEVATEAGLFGTLLAAVDTAELTATLEGEGPFTVFAPTDAAFTAFLTANDLTAEALLADEGLSEILLYHVIVGSEITSDLLEAGPFTTGAGLTAIATLEGGAEINGISLPADTLDIPASNGVIHVIDGVLLPPTIAELAGYAGGFDTLLQAVTQEGLDAPLADADASFTVFAPTDNAFATLLADLEITAEELLAFELDAFTPYISLSQVLSYHVIADVEVLGEEVETGFLPTLSGYSLYADATDGVVLNNGPTVETADLMATNGIIHVIDGVLLPPNIVELAQLAGGFDSLLAAAGVAEFEEGVTVADVLSEVDPDSEDGVTLFAPTDAAFSELPFTTDELLALEDLFPILAHHVIPGDPLLSTDITPGFYAMADGLSTVIAPNEDGDLAIDDAVIGPVDIVGTNGVIHVIDTVIFASDIPTLLGYHPSFTTLVTALATAELVDDVSFDPEAVQEADFTVFAPTNDAFAAFIAAEAITVADLLASESLVDILLYHVASGQFGSGDLGEGVPVLGFGGITAPVTSDGTTTTVGGAVVEEVDIEALNGVIHVMGGVMAPVPD